MTYDCTASLTRSALDPTPLAECGLLAHRGGPDRHAGLTTDGALVSWRDDDPGARRG